MRNDHFEDILGMVVIWRWRSRSDEQPGESRDMANKTLKPPFYRVVADCPQCGPVTVERKPHPKAGQRTESGAIQQPQPLSIVCSCRYHAKVTSAELVSERSPA